MSWTFFYPLAWLGATAIGVPIWLHLRRRAETPAIRFSAVRFLDDQPLPTRAPIRLENPWLLAMRILALVLLCSAFAWPYLPQDPAALVSESRVHILDNTLSHQAAGQFERQRDELAAVLQSTPPHEQVAVVELTEIPRVIAQFGDPRDEAAARVRSLAPSFARGSYLAAFRQANGLLATSLGERRQIRFWSDSQSNQWDSEPAVPPFLERVDLILPEISDQSLPNAGVSQPTVQRVFLGDRARLEGEATIRHQGTLDSVVVTVLINGRELLQKELALKDAPESIRLAFQWEDDARDWVRGEVRIAADRDALAADNLASFALPPLREGRVTLLANSPFLKAALSPEVMQGRWATTLANPADGILDKLVDADVLCLESRFLQSSDTRRLVHDSLHRGRGVFLLVDQLTPSVQAFLRELEVESRSVVNLPPESASFRYVFQQHPIFQPFRSPDFGSLLDIRVHRYRRLAAPQAIPLVFSQNGDLLMFQTQRERGKLLFTAFAMDREETNWPLHPSFIPFLDLCLQSVRSDDARPVHFEPGETCIWTVPPERAQQDLQLTRNGREVLRSPLQNGRVEFRVPLEPGLYEASLDGGTSVTEILQVNPAPQESLLEYRPAEEIVAAWTRPDEQKKMESRGSLEPMQLTRQEILGQSWWWWFLVGSGLFLGVETLWTLKR